MQVYLARLNCGTKDGDRHFHIIVGVFSTQRLADDALQNFVEGTIEMEYPNITVISQLVEEFVLDQPLDKGPAIETDYPSDISF